MTHYFKFSGIPIPESTNTTISMTHRSKKNEDKRAPAVWGPSFWYVIHIGSVNYPLRPTLDDMIGMNHFIWGLPHILPCVSCKTHATEYLQSNLTKIEEALKNSDMLFVFFVDFHNYVNMKLGKPQFSYSNARTKYREPSDVSFISY